jgi:hypothetical protein
MTPRDWGVMLEQRREDHVIPRDDLVEHTISETCVCGPELVTVDAAGGPCRHVTHRSLDGRETL